MLPPILLVDDNPIDVDLAMRVFQRASLPNPIQVARDGEEALSLIQRWDAGDPCPVIVLLDINLPKKNGIEVYQSLQSHLNYRSLPVVFLLSAEEDRLFLKKSLTVLPPCIVKPITINEFFQASNTFGLSWSFSPNP